MKLNRLYWIEEFLPNEVVSRPMHGGVGYYLDDKLVLILVESSLTYEHKGHTYPFQIWNGCVIPIEKIKQSAVWVRFQFLENHPANKDWLYLPADSEEIEEQIKLILKEIKKRNPLFGLPIKIKPATESVESIGEDNFCQPRMFLHGRVKKTPKKEKPNLKRASAKPKTDKKRENAFVLSVLKGKK